MSVDRFLLLCMLMFAFFCLPLGFPMVPPYCNYELLLSYHAKIKFKQTFQEVLNENKITDFSRLPNQ